MTAHNGSLGLRDNPYHLKKYFETSWRSNRAQLTIGTRSMGRCCENSGVGLGDEMQPVVTVEQSLLLRCIVVADGNENEGTRVGQWCGERDRVTRDRKPDFAWQVAH